MSNQTYTVNVLWNHFDTSTEGGVGVRSTRVKELAMFNDFHEASRAANEWLKKQSKMVLDYLKSHLCIVDNTGRLISYNSTQTFAVYIKRTRSKSSKNKSIVVHYSRIEGLPAFIDYHEASRVANEWVKKQPERILKDLDYQVCILNNSGQLIS